jgi:hypothetical protein
MDKLWENAPWFIPSFKQKDYLAELEHEVDAVAEKTGMATHVNDVKGV